MMVEAMRLFSSGDYRQAISLLQQVVAAEPSQFEPRLQLAKACLDWLQVRARKPLTEIEPAQLSEEALHFLSLAQSHIQILEKSQPSSPHVHSLSAMVYLVYARPEEALRSLRKVLAKEPRNPDALYNTGYALMEVERYKEAATQFVRLTALHPRHGMGWQMLGQARLMLGEPDAAVPAYERANALLPDWYQPYGGLASALHDLKRYQEAKETLRRGLQRHAENQDLNFSLATQSLSTEDWATGWRYFPCRSVTQPRLPFPEGHTIALTLGEPVRIRHDQGLGDELFFLRFVPGMVAGGMRIHYTTQSKLYPLLRGNAALDELVVAARGEDGAHDVLVGDLPYLTGMHSTADIPAPFALSVDTSRATRLREQLAAFGPPPYLGVTWAGGTPKRAGSKGSWRALHKDIPAHLLGRLARDWPGTVVVMQRLPAPDILAEFAKAMGRPFLDWSSINDDLADALAGLSLLDEYVGVSNTNMHLLAGIGKAARVLVPYPAEWRWMASGDESPWFPGFKVYRQMLGRSWDAALGKLGHDLSGQYRKREKQT